MSGGNGNGPQSSLVAKEFNHIAKKYQRSKNTQSADGTSPPSREEILSIAKASDLDPDNPEIIIDRCNLMIDYLKGQPNRFYWTGSVCFGKGYFFTTAGSILESVKEESRRALALDPKSDGLNIAMYEIFANRLPASLREPEYAVECLKNAVLYNPDCGRAFARLATYYLQSAGAAPEHAEQNVLLADKYFLEAMEIDGKNSNISSLIDFLKIRCLGRNSERLEELLETNINDSKWDDVARSKLYFIKGLYNFSKEENQKGLDAWLTGYNLNKQMVEKIKFIDRDGFRQSWPDTLKAEKIFVILGQLKRSGTLNDETSRILVQIRENLASQIQAPVPPKDPWKKNGPRRT